MFWNRRYGRERDAEFAKELTPKTPARGKKESLSETRPKAAQKDKTLAGGVTISPLPITAGEKVTIKYKGLLAQSGADSVYLHLGFGNRDWRNVKDLPMSVDKAGTWRTQVALDPNETSRLNFCFKDSANNWDNNYGLNWSLEVHNGQL